MESCDLRRNIIMELKKIYIWINIGYIVDVVKICLIEESCKVKKKKKKIRDIG